MLDFLIVGAGPAGASAALWARTLDLTVRVLEAGQGPGGQLHRIHFILRNVAGVSEGNGAVIAERLNAQLKQSGAELCFETRVASLEAPGEGAGVRVRTISGEVHEAAALLVATGLRPRRLGVPGERELEGRGVFWSATRELDVLARKTVAVVGGGDAGYENALILSAAGSRVVLVVRGQPHARAEFRERAAADRNIEVLEETEVAAILGHGHVEGVRLLHAGGTLDRAAEAVVVKVGNAPNTEWCRDVLEQDGEGYLVTRRELATSVPRVWAAGDVVRPVVPGIAVALGHGALAAAAVRQALRPSPRP